MMSDKPLKKGDHIVVYSKKGYRYQGIILCVNSKFMKIQDEKAGKTFTLNLDVIERCEFL